MKVFLTYDLIQWPGLIKWAILLKHLIKILVIIDMPDMPSFDPVFAVCHWTLCSKNQNFHTHYFFFDIQPWCLPLYSALGFVLIPYYESPSQREWAMNQVFSCYVLSIVETLLYWIINNQGFQLMLHKFFRWFIKLETMITLSEECQDQN